MFHYITHPTTSEASVLLASLHQLPLLPSSACLLYSNLATNSATTCN